MNRRWIAYFSQTGSEIYQISKALGRFPDKIITNNWLENKTTINPKLRKEASDRLFFCYKPDIRAYKAFIRETDLVTLHGWLKIVPPEICNKYEIYNGHPGLITLYPELKGKDPQKRAFKGKYERIGCVIHKVIAEVDAGEVEASAATDKLDDMTEDDIIETLHDMSIELWTGFLKGKI